MMRLDPHIEIVNLKFPQYILIEETEIIIYSLKCF